jgi:predicted ABC-type ATPase
VSDVVKHLPGKHDQSDHGRWAGGANVGLARKRFGDAVDRSRKLGRTISDPDFDGEASSRSVYATQQPDGSWLYDDDRAALHEAYYAKRLAEAEPVESPVVVFLGGGSGAGKSTLLRSGVSPIPDARVVSNPDTAKDFIPEFQQGKAAKDDGIAHAVHEESSMMSKEVQRRALEQGMNLVVDGTGDSDFKKIAGKVQAMRDRGASRVNGEYVTIPTEDAIARAMKRSLDPASESYGRVVPEKVIRSIHEGVSETVPQILEARLYDEFRLWDNSGEGKPRLVLEQTGGQTSVKDKALYKQFLMKAPKYADGEFIVGDNGEIIPLTVEKGRVLYDLTRI